MIWWTTWAASGANIGKRVFGGGGDTRMIYLSQNLRNVVSLLESRTRIAFRPPVCDYISLLIICGQKINSPRHTVLFLNLRLLVGVFKQLPVSWFSFDDLLRSYVAKSSRVSTGERYKEGHTLRIVSWCSKEILIIHTYVSGPSVGFPPMCVATGKAFIRRSSWTPRALFTSCASGRTRVQSSGKRQQIFTVEEEKNLKTWQRNFVRWVIICLAGTTLQKWFQNEWIYRCPLVFDAFCRHPPWHPFT